MERSIIKPHVHQFSGSGDKLEHLIIERCLAFGLTEVPPEYKPPIRHLIAAPTSRLTSLSWNQNGTRISREFTPGDLILNPGGCSVRPQWDRDTRLTLVAIKPSGITRVCEELEVSEFEVPELFHFKNGAMSRTIQRLISCFERTESMLLEAQTLEHTLIRCVVAQCRKSNEGGHRLSNVKLARVHDFIHDRLADTITLNELAIVAGYSPSRFLVLFGNATGFSPHQYVIQQRLEKARELISGTVLPFSAITAECGFTDQSHLIRLFKRYTGLTPSQFRRSD